MTTDLIISLLILAGVGLMAGAAYVWRKRHDGRNALLMLVASLVMFGNVAIWLMPTPQGETLADRAKQ